MALLPYIAQYIIYHHTRLHYFNITLLFFYYTAMFVEKNPLIVLPLFTLKKLFTKFWVFWKPDYVSRSLWKDLNIGIKKYLLLNQRFGLNSELIIQLRSEATVDLSQSTLSHTPKQCQMQRFLW